MIITNANLVLILGGMGTGKSTLSALISSKCLKNNINCYCNRDVHGTIKFDVFKDLLIYDYSNSVIIIDETGMYFNSRNSTNTKNRTFTDKHYEFFSTLRHRHTQIFIIVQSWKRIDTVLRELAQEIMLVEKLFWHLSIYTRYKTHLKLQKSMVSEELEVETSSEFVEFYKKLGMSFFWRKKYYWMFDSYEDMYFNGLPYMYRFMTVIKKPLGQIAKLARRFSYKLDNINYIIWLYKHRGNNV